MVWGTNRAAPADKRLLDKHVVQAAPRHILTEEEDRRAAAEWDDKERRRLELQERVRCRQAEAEAKNPKLEAKNPHLL